MRTFARNVSLALTDAHTFEQMNRAAHDTLTGLASRGLFLDQLTEQLAGVGGGAGAGAGAGAESGRGPGPG